jgi:hypothetical protein
MVLHNIVIHLNEEEPVLPPNVASAAFQERLQRFQMDVVVIGRPVQNSFNIRNLIIGQYF